MRRVFLEKKIAFDTHRRFTGLLYA